MAKKSRRARAKRRTSNKLQRRGPGIPVQPPEAVVKPKTTVSSVEPSSSRAQTARYQYVLSDLRRIGIIGGVLFLVLVVLTFILG